MFFYPKSKNKVEIGIYNKFNAKKGKIIWI